MSEGLDVEIIMHTDNKVSSIGRKCSNLMHSSIGKYFMFIHDDDELTSVKEIYDATFHDVDVIDFKAECKNSDGSVFIVTQKLGNEIEHNTKDGRYLDCNRPPFPNCAWNHKFKYESDFPDISYGEDAVFIEHCLKTATEEIFIDKVLFKYNFSPTVTEASTESNSHWTNPNPKKISKRCIVNVSTEKYWPGQTRLIKSIHEHSPNIDILTWGSESEVGAELHEMNNYSFKPMAIIKAYQLGYKQFLWLDASMNIIKDLSPIFDIIDKDGYFFVDSGWLNNRWTNDKAIEYFGTNEGEMLSSGILGLDLTNETAYKFFDLWTQSMRDGIFNGSWQNFRHDQSCASLIAHKMGLKYQPANTFMVYGLPNNKFISEQTIALADGIC
jgi:hypothetical protein